MASGARAEQRKQRAAPVNLGEARRHTEKTGTGHLLLLRAAHKNASCKEPPRCVGPTLTSCFFGGGRASRISGGALTFTGVERP